jgi:hypothetical protein
MRKTLTKGIGVLGILGLAAAARLATPPPASAGPSCQQRCYMEFLICHEVHPAPPPEECDDIYQQCLASCH